MLLLLPPHAPTRVRPADVVSCCAVAWLVRCFHLQAANRMFGNFGELLDLHASHKIYGGDATEEEEQLEEEEEVRGGEKGQWVAVSRGLVLSCHSTAHTASCSPAQLQVVQGCSKLELASRSIGWECSPGLLSRPVLHYAPPPTSKPSGKRCWEEDLLERDGAEAERRAPDAV